MRLQCCALLFTTGLSSLSYFGCSGELSGPGNQDVEKRIYDFKKLGGSTCAYTASWLSHVNLFRRVTWCVCYVSSRSMKIS